MTEKIFDMIVTALPFLLHLMLHLMLALAVTVIAVLVFYTLHARWPRGPFWRHADLYVEKDDCTLGPVWWRRSDGRIKVEYTIVNWLPGRHEYRNDHICVFQRGIRLEEDGDRVSHVLPQGAEVRFSQTFLARDGSTPVIQADSSYTPARN
ncbi:hypothetical protein [Bifidobacterium castoris]|uniref:Uncharacterized protein n=1 Tax=Bifidobacterium castoris TaxID=2306972 RepID=A0A430FAE8_9BIFI|nr:hypothetical protein [Bifidobacterium castoris]RSX49817.1 hypothetical protein D2E22_0278 [Bifidobacterium castoris]